MSRIYTYVGIIALCISTFSSCKKDTISLDYTEYNAGADTKLRGIYFLDENTGFVCGGEKNSSGVILRTTDGGQNWLQVYSSTLSVRDITFINNSLGYACGDSLLILKTVDGGQNWMEVELPYTPVNIVPLTSVQFLDAQHGFICGGEDWEQGIALRTADGGSWWDYQAFYNTEITENYFINDTTGYFSAYGSVFRATADVLTNVLLDIDGDFFTSITFTSVDEGFLCGYDGGIYKTSDAGAGWKQVRKDNAAFQNRVHFNKIRFADPNRGVAVGNNGAVFYSDDGGNSWKQSDNFPDEHIYSAFILDNNTAILAAGGGKIYKVSI